MRLPFVLLLLVGMGRNYEATGTSTNHTNFATPFDYQLFYWQGNNSLQYDLGIRVPPDSRRFTIEFCPTLECTMDKVLHFRARFDKRQVARSHRLNGRWSSEVTSGVMPFERGSDFSIKIICKLLRFEIYVGDVFLCQYNSVFHRESQKFMKIFGKVEITHLTEFVDKSTLSPTTGYLGFKRYPTAGDRLQFETLLAADWRTLGKFNMELKKIKENLWVSQIKCEFAWPSSTFTLICTDENACHPVMTRVTLDASKWFTISVNFSINNKVKFFYKQIYLGEVHSDYSTVRSLHFLGRIADYKIRLFPAL